MRKSILLLFIFHLSFFTLKAQNLVANPSFEQYDTCPTKQCQIQHAIGWSCYRNCIIYFNSCAPFGNVGVPYNAGGFQYAASGHAYAGAYFYYPNSGGGGYNGVYNREYLGTALLSPLVISTKYYVTFKVNLSAIDSTLGATCAVNKIGALFTSAKYTCDSVSTLPPNHAQVYTNTIISDTLNWTTIQGSFIADSAYKYLVIGNFFTDSATSKKYFFNPVNRPDTAAYYYIDDVCVSTDSTYCADWTGINEINSPSSVCVKVSPNPFSNQTDISISCIFKGPFSLTIYNPLGQVVRKMDNIRNSNITIKKENLPPGIYFYKLSNETEIIKNGKLIIESTN